MFPINSGFLYLLKRNRFGLPVIVIHQVVSHRSFVYPVVREGIERVAHFHQLLHLYVRCLRTDIIGVAHFASARLDGNDAEWHSQITVSRSDAYVVDCHIDRTGFHGYVRHLSHISSVAQQVDLTILISDDQLPCSGIVGDMYHACTIQSRCFVPIHNLIVRFVHAEK